MLSTEDTDYEKFDGLPYQASDVNPVGIFAGLEWQNFNIFHSSNTSKTGHSVLPQSKPAVAVGNVDHGGVYDPYTYAVMP